MASLSSADCCALTSKSDMCTSMSALGQSRTSGGTLEPCVDLGAEEAKIDGLGEKRIRAALQHLALGVRIAIGSDHNDRNIRSSRLGFGQQLKPCHSRHVDVGQDQNEGHARGVSDTLKRHVAGLRKFHREATLPQVPPQIPAEHHLDIRFVIDNENK